MPTSQHASASNGYSASVRLTLRVGQRRLALAQVAPTWVLFDQPVRLSPGPAVLEIDIDGRCSPINIELEPGEMPARRVSYDLSL